MAILLTGVRVQNPSRPRVLQHLRGGVSVFRGEGFDDVRLHQLMGDGRDGRNGMADVAVKDFGNLMAALDFAAFVIDESDIVAGHIGSGCRAMYSIMPCVMPISCRRLRIKMFWNARKPAASPRESFITAVAGISASMRLTA